MPRITTGVLTALPSTPDPEDVQAGDPEPTQGADNLHLPVAPAAPQTAEQPTVRRRRRNAAAIEVPLLPPAVPGPVPVQDARDDRHYLGAMVIAAFQAGVSLEEYAQDICAQADAWRRLRGGDELAKHALGG